MTGSALPTRYDTLDLFRVVSVWGIVLLHVHVLAGGSTHDVVIRMRDFAMPVLILASFFVMAFSFERRPDRPFGQFLSRRVSRILVPSVVWSLLYWVGWWMVRPVLKGEPAVWPPLSLAITAHMHLWYLHFIFFSSVLLAPLLTAVSRRRINRNLVAIVLLVGAVAIIGWVQPRLLVFTTAAQAGPLYQVANPAPDWMKCLSLVAPFLGYAPLGLALGLWHRPIAILHRRGWFQIAAAAAAAIVLAVHLAVPGLLFTRPLLAFTVFLAITRPISSQALAPLRQLAGWTYVIYILHFGIAILYVAALDALEVARGPWISLANSVVVYAASFAAGVMRQRLLPLEWLLPMVPVGQEQRPLQTSAHLAGRWA
jgi:peptidoglycan/LPS O-acetylase OafA/YrhL